MLSSFGNFMMTCWRQQELQGYFIVEQEQHCHCKACLKCLFECGAKNRCCWSRAAK